MANTRLAAKQHIAAAESALLPNIPPMPPANTIRSAATAADSKLPHISCVCSSFLIAAESLSPAKIPIMAPEA